MHNFNYSAWILRDNLKDKFKDNSKNNELVNLTKKQIIQKGISLNAPLHLTWCCYNNEINPCEKCDSCALRARGFVQAKIKDPIIL